MRPIFTIYAGEFMVGAYLEGKFKKKINVWVPTKDIGVDLLVTNSRNTRVVSFQVKFSRDYLTTAISAEFQDPMRACSWFKLNRDKIVKSPANFWVFALIGSKKRTRDYVVIKPADLLKRLNRIHGKQGENIYIWVTEAGRCWETRGLSKSKLLEIANSTFLDTNRDLTPYLNNWKMIENM